jgi:hypothetical protein
MFSRFVCKKRRNLSLYQITNVVTSRAIEYFEITKKMPFFGFHVEMECRQQESECNNDGTWRQINFNLFEDLEK